MFPYLLPLASPSHPPYPTPLDPEHIFTQQFHQIFPRFVYVENIFPFICSFCIGKITVF